MEYEAVIGLEVHVQLKTASKMFTSVGTGFAMPPNSLTDPLVMGLPGSLPVINREAVEKSIKVALLLDGTVPEITKWDRKNYFYPDLPKSYQITQFDQPICGGGKVEIELPGSDRSVMGEHRWVAITRAHLEEDVGKLNHIGDYSLVDYNRAGTPLLEIVTEPDIYSADEAFAFLTALRNLMVAGEISDCDMEKGQLRCDANISVRPAGSKKLGTKVELKNLNSISGVRNGVAYEIERQTSVLLGGGSIIQETRRWDAQKGLTTSMRQKEDSHDYRYFPDPDLMPVRIDKAWRDRVAATLPERPFDRQRRFLEEYGLPYATTSVLVPDRLLCDYYEAVAEASGEPRKAANWVANELLREMASSSLSMAECPVPAAHMASLVQLIEKGTISRSLAATDVFPEMFQTGKDPATIIKEKNLGQSSDTGELEGFCQTVIDNNPGVVEEFRSGKDKAINFLKGQVMKASKGKANPAVVDQLLRKLIG